MKFNIYRAFKSLFKSSKLKCPKNYDKKKFKKILQLFKYLDGDGDRVITSNEMKKFCDTYYECELEDKLNEIKNIHKSQENKIEISIQNLKLVLKAYIERCHDLNKSDKLTLEQKIHLMEQEEKHRTYMNLIAYNHTNKIIKLKLEIDLIKKLGKKEKTQKLVRDIGKKKLKEVGFRHFFKFIKNKNIDKMINILEE